MIEFKLKLVDNGYIASYDDHVVVFEQHDVIPRGLPRELLEYLLWELISDIDEGESLQYDVNIEVKPVKRKEI